MNDDTLMRDFNFEDLKVLMAIKGQMIIISTFNVRRYLFHQLVCYRVLPILDYRVFMPHWWQMVFVSFCGVSDSRHGKVHW